MKKAASIRKTSTQPEASTTPATEIPTESAGVTTESAEAPTASTETTAGEAPVA